MIDVANNTEILMPEEVLDALQQQRDSIIDAQRKDNAQGLISTAPGGGMNNPDPNTPDPDTPAQPEPERFFGLSVRTLITLAAVFGGCIVLAVVVCNVVPKSIEQFAPGPTPVPVPTWTPVPTFTPVPQPTATPKPIADLPLQQLHYNQYRIFHLIYEYRKCYEAHVRPSVPTPTPQPAEDGATPTPTPTPEPTPVPGAFEGRHRAPGVRTERARDRGPHPRRHRWSHSLAHRPLQAGRLRRAHPIHGIRRPTGLAAPVLGAVTCSRPPAAASGRPAASRPGSSSGC